MNITIDDVLSGTDFVEKLLDLPRGQRFKRHPLLRWGDILYPETVPPKPKTAKVPLSERSEADRIADMGYGLFGLNVKPLDLTDPDGNYVNAFEQRMYHHERPLPPRPQRPARTGRPQRKPVSLGEPVPTGIYVCKSCGKSPCSCEPTDAERREALATALNIDNINDLED